MTDDDQIMLCAFRYCLGRATYVVSDCCRWLRERWSTLSADVKAIVQREIREAVAQDKANNERGFARRWSPLGHPQDADQWIGLLRWMEKQK